MEEVNSVIASMQQAVGNCVRLFGNGSGSTSEPAVRLRVEVEPVVTHVEDGAADDLHQETEAIAAVTGAGPGESMHALQQFGSMHNVIDNTLGTKVTLKRKLTFTPYQRRSSLMHSALYEDLPESIKSAFDERIHARMVPKPYKKSEQTRYGAVSEQSGTNGIVEGMFQVEVTVPGTCKHLRLGRVSDTRMGAFLWCANFVDENLHDGNTLAAFLEKIFHEKDFAEAWLSHVQGRIPMIQKVHSSRIVPLIRSCPLTVNLSPPKKRRVTEEASEASPAQATVAWSAVLSNLVEASPIATEQHKFLNASIQLYHNGNVEKQELFDLFVHQFGKEAFASAILKVHAEKEQEQKRKLEEEATDMQWVMQTLSVEKA